MRSRIAVAVPTLTDRSGPIDDETVPVELAKDRVQRFLQAYDSRAKEPRMP